MNKDFKVYLKNIGMTDILIKRVEDIYNFYQVVSPDELTDIFVTDFIKEDGSREFENLWLFTKSYMMEAKGFISHDDFDMTLMRKQITYWSVEKQDYDFQKSTDKSRLHILIRLTFPLAGDLKASKENCDYLKNIFHKFVLPNFIN
jgi:hypothetical protein